MLGAGYGMSKRMIRACYGPSIKFSIPPHYLTNFKIQKLSKFIKINLDLMEFILEIICQKNKAWTYVINIDGYAVVGTH